MFDKTLAVVRVRDALSTTSGSNTHGMVYVGILNNSRHHCTRVKSIVGIAIGRTVPHNGIGGNSILGTMMIHAHGNIHHPSNSVVHFSHGTYMLLGSAARRPINAHVFNPIAHRLHGTGFVGVISLTPRILWKTIE